MPKRPENLETLVLALELLKRIPRRGKITAPELQRQLAGLNINRDLRTIQRQLELLSEHFDIDRDDRSRPYGYCWKEKAVGLSLPTLNEQESVLLTLAEWHLRHLLPSRLLGSMSPFFARARPKMEEPSTPTQDKLWLKKVRVVSTSQPLLPPKISSQVFEATSNALYADHWLDVHYRNAEDHHTQSRVMPLGLAQQGTRLFLVCRFEGYDNERSLALHRVISAQDTGLPFTRPKDFDLAQFDADGQFGFGEGKRIKLVFRISKKAGFHLLESPLSADQSYEDNVSHYTISATVVNSLQLKWWLRGFGADVEVLAPADWKS